jgi:hypothetical protein
MKFSLGKSVLYLRSSTYSTSPRETEYNNSAAEEEIALRVMYHNIFVLKTRFIRGMSRHHYFH